MKFICLVVGLFQRVIRNSVTVVNPIGCRYFDILGIFYNAFCKLSAVCKCVQVNGVQWHMYLSFVT